MKDPFLNRIGKTVSRLRGAHIYYDTDAPDAPIPIIAFYGSKYSQLLAVKTKYDPNGVFTVYKGVGWADGQDSSDICYVNA